MKTDLEKYIDFLDLFGFEYKTHKLQNGEVGIISEEQYKSKKDNIEFMGYDYMETCAIFTNKGILIKGAMDSHVAYYSNIKKEILELLKSKIL